MSFRDKPVASLSMYLFLCQLMHVIFIHVFDTTALENLLDWFGNRNFISLFSLELLIISASMFIIF